PSAVPGAVQAGPEPALVPGRECWMVGKVLRPTFPRRRVWLIVLRNGVRYLVRGAAKSWTRNLGTIAPALGSMTILLLLSGFAGLGWYSLRSAAARASADAAVLHVYLRDDAT